MRKFADILEEITGCELAIASANDPGGHQANRLAELRNEVLEHPDGAPGRNLPPIVGRLGC